MSSARSLVVLFALGACSGGKSKVPSGQQLMSSDSSAGSTSASVAQNPAVSPSKGPRPGCDATLWNHVYNPTRLQQLTSCLTATGVIDESDVDADGDQHFLLKLDPGQDSLVNKRNAKKKGGELVLEIVCANPAKLKKAKSACAGYTNPVPIPAVGAHVRVTGTYVIDTHNGWTEIHPVSHFDVF
jgi:hypothetical protein